VNATGTSEALAVLQAEIAKIEPARARIEEARSELAALELQVEGKPQDSKQRTAAAEATLPRRRSLIEHITTLEDGEKDRKVSLAEALKQAAPIAIGLLKPALDEIKTNAISAMRPLFDSLETAREAVQKTAAYRAAQHTLNGLEHLTSPYASDHPVRVLVEWAKHVETILAEARKDSPDFSLFIRHRPTADRGAPPT
jgi:chromosome segregation ATPase